MKSPCHIKGFEAPSASTTHTLSPCNQKKKKKAIPLSLLEHVNFVI